MSKSPITRLVYEISPTCLRVTGGSRGHAITWCQSNFKRTDHGCHDNEITACAVATSCCISDEPCQWKKGKFWPPTAPTFIDRSSWNSNLRNMFSRPPHMPNFVTIGLRWWAGRTPSLSQFWFFLCFFLFVYSSHGVLPIPLGQLRRTMAHRTCFPPR